MLKQVEERAKNFLHNSPAMNMNSETISSEWKNKFGSIRILDKHGLKFNESWF
jgi:hypothetical protein